jgi:hypothetical protein
MTPTTCCGRRPRVISIDLIAGHLAAAYCNVCEITRWSRDGQAVDLGVVKSDAAAQFNKKLARS